MVCAAFFLVQRMLAPNAVLQRSKSSKLVTQCLLQTDWTVVRVPYTEFRFVQNNQDATFPPPNTHIQRHNTRFTQRHACIQMYSPTH
eukprot:m.264211 g.264211  ORF g.264211 m.264211 type:complete len:87 (-) comp15610_c1_seq11:658-918(-)